MKKIILILLILIGNITTLGVENDKSETPIIPMIPLLPAIEKDETKKAPLETKTLIMGMKTEVIVPLEIISDIEIQAMVVDDQEIEVPFEIEFNKTPNKNRSYALKYSETEIDIDNDGTKDTFIYSNKNINSKILGDNKVIIKGKNISKEGYHEKIVYIDVEIHE